MDTLRVIWSYSTLDPLQTVGLAYHGGSQRGSRSLQLLNNQATPPKKPDDAFSFDLFFDQVT